MRTPSFLGRRGVAAAAGVSFTGLAMLLVVAGCSAGSAGKTASSTGTSAASSSTVTAPASNRAADFRAYTQCLTQHGVAVPTFSARPRPSGSFVRPSGAPRSGGPGGRFGFLGSADPSTRAAIQACQSLAPQGGFGFGRGGDATISATTFAAFKSCMSDNGVTISQTDPQQALRSLNRSDAKTAAALKVCDPILGRPGASPSPTG
ncbi:MAG TPA: hypothetical protein VFN80_07485 [Acidothermaceae bacterium]|nr:hypothetical protein [Acidothermaceae bacterium]